MRALRASLYFVSDSLFGGGFIRQLRFLRGTQSWTPNRLADLQSEQLRRIVSHAATTVPYYRDLFHARGIRVEDIREPADLVKIPVLKKAVVRERLPELISEASPENRRVPRRTGGSTGQPLNLFIDKTTKAWEMAAYWRGLEWAGYRPGSPCLQLFGGSLGLSKNQFRHRLRAWMLSETVMSALALDRSNLNQYLNAIDRSHPKFAVGYASALDELGRLSREAGHPVHFAALFPRGEKVTPALRARLEGYFEAEVFDGYGGGEANSVSAECGAHQGMHVSDELYILETLDASGHPVTAGEGRVTVTTLRNGTMPLIRYQNDDVAVLDPAPCPCGRGLSKIKEITGRTNDYLLRRDGSRVSPSFAPHLFLRLGKGIEEGQLVQESLDSVRLRIIPSADFGDDTVAAAVNAIIATLGDVTVQTEVVDQIYELGQEKRRFQICLIPSGIEEEQTR